MSDFRRTILLVISLAILSGCDPSSVPSSPTQTPVPEEKKHETPEEFMLRLVRSAELVMYHDRDSPDDFMSDGSFTIEDDGTFMADGSPYPLTFDWTFGKKNFSITSSTGNLPEPLMVMLLGNPYPARSVRGQWEARIIDGRLVLLLTNFRTDQGHAVSMRTLDAFQTGPEELYVSGDTTLELKFEVHARSNP